MHNIYFQFSSILHWNVNSRVYCILFLNKFKLNLYANLLKMRWKYACFMFDSHVAHAQAGSMLKSCWASGLQRVEHLGREMRMLRKSHPLQRASFWICTSKTTIVSSSATCATNHSSMSLNVNCCYKFKWIKMEKNVNQ